MKEKVIIYIILALVIFIAFDAFLLQDIQSEKARYELYGENYDWLKLEVTESIIIGEDENYYYYQHLHNYH